jgi:hypothetical protein
MLEMSITKVGNVEKIPLFVVLLSLFRNYCGALARFDRSSSTLHLALATRANMYGIDQFCIEPCQEPKLMYVQCSLSKYQVLIILNTADFQTIAILYGCHMAHLEFRLFSITSLYSTKSHKVLLHILDANMLQPMQAYINLDCCGGEF